MPRFSSLKVGLLAAVIGALGATASCSEDGVTTNCPALPLYQTYALGDASIPDAQSPDSPASQEMLAAAVDAGCATAPHTGVMFVAGGGSSAVGGGTSGGGSAGKAGGGGSAGKGGSGGSAGKGGNGGSAGKGGASSADSAGAAGSN
jgi:hypothetical protein